MKKFVKKVSATVSAAASAFMVTAGFAYADGLAKATDAVEKFTSELQTFATPVAILAGVALVIAFMLRAINLSQLMFWGMACVLIGAVPGIVNMLI